jgi:hypothetical protein
MIWKHAQKQKVKKATLDKVHHACNKLAYVSFTFIAKLYSDTHMYDRNMVNVIMNARNVDYTRCFFHRSQGLFLSYIACNV